ncbi:MAG: DinB family protein [Anaerolineales bacterium]
MDPKINALISKLEQSRASLNASMEKVTPQAEIYPTWKLKQLLDHITGWDELTSQSLRQYLHGKTPALAVKDGINQFNADSISARKALTLEQSRLAYEQARQDVLQALREIPAEKLTQKFPAPWGGNCTVTSVVKLFSSHELEHAKQLEEFLQESTRRD